VSRQVGCERTNQVGVCVCVTLAVGRRARSFANSSDLSQWIQEHVRCCCCCCCVGHIGHACWPAPLCAAAAAVAIDLMALKYDVISVDGRHPFITWLLMKRKIAWCNIGTDREAH